MRDILLEKGKKGMMVMLNGIFIFKSFCIFFLFILVFLKMIVIYDDIWLVVFFVFGFGL